MSISSSANRNTYTGNGSTETYPYSFKITDQDHLRVVVRDDEGVETVLTITTHYTVTGVGVAGGGNVVLVDGDFDWIDAEGDLGSDYILSIRRVVPITQETDIRNQGSFFPETHEDVFDYAVFIDQQQQDELERSIRLPETVNPEDFSNVIPATIIGEANRVLMVNDTGDGWDVGPTADAIEEASQDAADAAASATAAANSATAAAASATAADVSADEAAAAATAAADAAIATHEADTSTHGVGVVVGTTEAQTLTNKTVDVLTYDGQGSTPANPAAGFYKVFVKDATGKLAVVDSAGTVSDAGGFDNTITDALALDSDEALSISTTAKFQTFRIQADALGEKILNAAPFGESPPPDGSVIVLVGNSDEFPVVIQPSDTADGCLMNGNIIFYKGTVGMFMYIEALERYVRFNQ